MHDINLSSLSIRLIFLGGYILIIVLLELKIYAQSLMHNISLNSQYIKKAQNAPLTADNLNKRTNHECLIKLTIYMKPTTFRSKTPLLYKKVLDDLKFKYASC